MHKEIKIEIRTPGYKIREIIGNNGNYYPSMVRATIKTNAGYIHADCGDTICNDDGVITVKKENRK